MPCRHVGKRGKQLGWYPRLMWAKTFMQFSKDPYYWVSLPFSQWSPSTIFHAGYSIFLAVAVLVAVIGLLVLIGKLLRGDL